jgi:hypothetical protein
MEWKLDPRDIQVISYTKGQYVVKPGDPDDSILVVLEGEGLSVLITVSAQFVHQQFTWRKFATHFVCTFA